MQRRSGIASLLLLGASIAGCFMTADESLWQRRDARPEARLDLASPDARGPDAPLADRRADQPGAGDARSDTRRADMPKPPDLLTPDGACHQMQLQVASASDDGEIDMGGWNVDGEAPHIFMGFWDGASTWGYFRFALQQAIPKGATITAAALTLYGTASASWDSATHGLTIWAEDSADAPLVIAAGNAPFAPTGRAVTSAYVRWPASGGLTWTVGADNVTPSLVPVLQEVVNKVALPAGSHVQLWIRGAQSVESEVGAPDYKHPSYSSHPHRLTITWCQ